MEFKELTLANIGEHVALIEEDYDRERDKMNFPKAHIAAYTSLGIFKPEMVLDWVRGEIALLPLRERYIDQWLQGTNKLKSPDEVKKRQHQILTEAFEQAYSGREEPEEDPTGLGAYTNELLTAHLRLAIISGIAPLPLAEQLSLLTFARVSTAQVQLIDYHERNLPIYSQPDEEGRFTLRSIHVGGGIEYAQSHLHTALKWADLETEVRKIEPSQNEEADQMLTQVYDADKQLTLFIDYTCLLALLTSRVTQEQLYRFSYYEKAKNAIEEYLRLAQINSQRLLANPA